MSAQSAPTFDLASCPHLLDWQKASGAFTGWGERPCTYRRSLRRNPTKGNHRPYRVAVVRWIAPDGIAHVHRCKVDSCPGCDSISRDRHKMASARWRKANPELARERSRANVAAYRARKRGVGA